MYIYPERRAANCTPPERMVNYRLRASARRRGLRKNVYDRQINNRYITFCQKDNVCTTFCQIHNECMTQIMDI